MKRGCKPTAKDDKYREKKVNDLKPNMVCTRMMTRQRDTDSVSLSSQYDNNDNKGYIVQNKI